MTARPVHEVTGVLVRNDPVMADLIDRFGPPRRVRPAPTAERFASVARIIVFQQLAGVAAEAIHGRFRVALGGQVTPESVLASSPEVLAGCGLSRAKATSIRELAERTRSGQVSFNRIGRLTDQQVVDHLTQVRGVGPWTAHMFLLNGLGRPDVWPTGDYGVRAGFARGWGLDTIPSPRELEAQGERFRPFRSAVAWYCWRLMDDRTATE